ncbi:MAG: hypothetical protein ACR2GO_04235, partial [Candidatus Limnocylindria bacterium]
NGLLDDVETTKVAEFESGLYRHLESGYEELLPTIAKDKVLSDETTVTLEKAVAEFKRQGGYGKTDDAAAAASPKTDDAAAAASPKTDEPKPEADEPKPETDEARPDETRPDETRPTEASTTGSSASVDAGAEGAVEESATTDHKA